MGLITNNASNEGDNVQACLVVVEKYEHNNKNIMMQMIA